VELDGNMLTRLTAPLISDHRSCDGLFAQAENAAGRHDWSACLRQFDLFLEAMIRHFRVEEENLFPAFERASGSASGPTAMMRMEHENMRELLRDMGEAIRSRGSDDYLGLSETLLLYMQQHNIKEENILYPAADRMLGTAGLDLAAFFSRRE
jgi:hemerythrin-like domain-containing protein